MNTNKIIYLTIISFLTLVSTQAQIIDVHLHSYTDSDYWGGQVHPTGIESPPTADEHLENTLALMDKHQIAFAVVSGSIESIEKYVKADSRFIPGYMDSEMLIPIDTFELLIKEGKIKVFGEVAGVYFGRTLNDPIYAPYLEICQEYSVPVAYHTGGGPPMTPYRCCPKFRITLGDPFLIEDVLIKYPDLQIYLMHGGEVYFENTVRMMKMYRHLYIDLGVVLWVDPMIQDYGVRLLKLAQKANVLDRVMFGTDQMVWPGSISKSIEFFNALDFLDEKEKRMILYDNAKKFLRISE